MRVGCLTNCNLMRITNFFSIVFLGLMLKNFEAKLMKLSLNTRILFQPWKVALPMGLKIAN